MQSRDRVRRHIALSPGATAAYSTCVLCLNQVVSPKLTSSRQGDGSVHAESLDTVYSFTPRLSLSTLIDYDNIGHTPR